MYHSMIYNEIEVTLVTGNTDRTAQRKSAANPFVG
jgi:hypothetical protein